AYIGFRFSFARLLRLRVGSFLTLQPAARYSYHQQGRSHATSFRHQDIVCAASRRGVHDLDADTARLQTGRDTGMRETNLRPGAEDEDLGIQFDGGLQMLCSQIFEALWRPTAQQGLGAEDQA